jgi:hypothetical protein
MKLVFYANCGHYTRIVFSGREGKLMREREVPPRSSSLENNVAGKQRKEREISITFFRYGHPTVFSSRLASDAGARGAQVLTHFVISGRKIDEWASFLPSPLFPVKNLQGAG